MHQDGFKFRKSFSGNRATRFSCKLKVKVRAHKGLARRGHSESETSCIPAAFGIENSLLHPKIGNIGATLRHHEAILHSYISIIVSIGRFCARGSGSCTRYQLLGRWRDLNTPAPVNVCTPDIALSIQSEFRTGVKLSSRIAPAPRSTPDRP